MDTQSDRDQRLTDGAARVAAVERSRTPGWYYPAGGIVLGAATVAILTGSGIIPGLAALVMAILNFLMEQLRFAITGARFSEFRERGEARAIVIIWIVAILAVLITGLLLHNQTGQSWIGWATGITLAAIYICGGLLFERARVAAARVAAVR